MDERTNRYFDIKCRAQFPKTDEQNKSQKKRNRDSDFFHKLHHVREQMRPRVDIADFRVRSVDEESPRADGRSVGSLNNDEQWFSSHITRRRLRHKYRLMTPVHTD